MVRLADAFLDRTGEAPLLLANRQAATFGVVMVLDGALPIPPGWSDGVRLR